MPMDNFGMQNAQPMPTGVEQPLNAQQFGYQDPMQNPPSFGAPPQGQMNFMQQPEPSFNAAAPNMPAMPDFNQQLPGFEQPMQQMQQQNPAMPNAPLGGDIYGNPSFGIPPVGAPSSPMLNMGMQNMGQDFGLNSNNMPSMPMQQNPMSNNQFDGMQNNNFDPLKQLQQGNNFGGQDFGKDSSFMGGMNDYGNSGSMFDGNRGFGANQSNQDLMGTQFPPIQPNNDFSQKPKDVFDGYNNNSEKPKQENSRNNPFDPNRFDQDFSGGKRGNFREAVSENGERPVQPKRPTNNPNDRRGPAMGAQGQKNRPPQRPGMPPQGGMPSREGLTPSDRRPPNRNPGQPGRPPMPGSRPSGNDPSRSPQRGSAQPRPGVSNQAVSPKQKPAGAPPIAANPKTPPQMPTPVQPEPKVDIAEIQSKLEQAVVIADFDKIFTQNNLFKFPDRSYINIRESTSKYLLSSADDEGIPVFSNVTANFPVSSCTVVTSEDEATKYAVARLVGTGMGLASGDILINGNEVRSRSIMSEVLYIDDDSMVPDRMTVFDFLMQCIAKVQLDDEEKIKNLTEILEKLGLDKVADDTMKLFSTARKVMVLLIAATQNPLIKCVVINFRKLLLEPEDEVRMMKVFEMLRLRDITVIMNDCNDILSSNLPNRVLALKEGEVAFNGGYREFIENYCEEIMTFEAENAEMIENIAKGFDKVTFTTEEKKVMVKGKGADASTVENIIVELSKNEIDLKTVRLGVRSFVLGRKELVKQ